MTQVDLTKRKTLKEFSIPSVEDESKKVKYLIVSPTAFDIRDADWKYSAAYSLAIREGLITNKQMAQKLYDHGHRRDVKLFTEYYEELDRLEKELEKEEDKALRQVLALQLKDIRDSLYAEESELREPFNYTAEKASEERKIDFLVSRMVCGEKGTLLWEDTDGFLNETNYPLAEEAKYHVLMWYHGLNEDWEKDLPESKVLEQMATDYLKATEEEIKQLELEEAEEKTEVVGSEGKKEKKTKSTRGRKRKASNKKASDKKVVESTTSDGAQV